MEEPALPDHRNFVFEYRHGRRWWRLVVPPWVLRWPLLLMLLGHSSGAL